MFNRVKVVFGVLSAVLSLNLMCTTAFAADPFMDRDNLCHSQIFLNVKSIEVNSINEIDTLYNSVDGTYHMLYEDGTQMFVTITSEDISFIGTASIKGKQYAQYKTYDYKYKDSNNNLLWKSSVVGLFHFDGNNVWCTEGTAYIDADKFTLNKNTFSSKKVKGYSYYTIDATVKKSGISYRFEQSIASNPNGESRTVFEWK